MMEAYLSSPAVSPGLCSCSAAAALHYGVDLDCHIIIQPGQLVNFTRASYYHLRSRGTEFIWSKQKPLPVWEFNDTNPFPIHSRFNTPYLILSRTATNGTRGGDNPRANWRPNCQLLVTELTLIQELQSLWRMALSTSAHDRPVLGLLPGPFCLPFAHGLMY